MAKEKSVQRNKKKTNNQTQKLQTVHFYKKLTNDNLY